MVDVHAHESHSAANTAAIQYVLKQFFRAESTEFLINGKGACFSEVFLLLLLST